MRQKTELTSSWYCSYFSDVLIGWEPSKGRRQGQGAGRGALDCPLTFTIPSKDITTTSPILHWPAGWESGRARGSRG